MRTLPLEPAEQEALEQVLDAAFAEDLGPAGIDLTEPAVRGVEIDALLVARQDGVVAGLAPAVRAFERRGVAGAAPWVADGARVNAGTTLLQLRGEASAVLAAERTALNLVQRLAGTATLTRAFVDAIRGTDAKIYDTRKTIPGMRALQRWAVRCGGGSNHRFGLFDEAMLKDNHIAAAGGITSAVELIRRAHPTVRIHVEADTVAQASEAADAGADVILLDNMTLDQLTEAVGIVGDRALTEASGGVTLATVGDIARTGVDRISVGAITHSAPAFDAALDVS